MAHINRRFIDKHWTVFWLRGLLAGVFGLLALFGTTPDLGLAMAAMSVFLLLMGIVDSVGALYASMKKRGWVNAVVDAVVDIAAALALLFAAQDNLVMGVVILAVYTVASGLIDVVHGFVSTVDPTDRFIRILAGVVGCVIGIVILNAGGFEVSTFVRFFGAYMLVVGVTSLIYGTHNRAQEVEDCTARRESVKKRKTSKAVKAGGASKTAKTSKAAKSSKTAKKK